MASQITSPTIVYSTVYSGADQRKHQSSASLAFVWGVHRWPVNSPCKWPVTRKMFPFDDVILENFPAGVLRTFLTETSCVDKNRNFVKSPEAFRIFNHFEIWQSSRHVAIESPWSDQGDSVARNPRLYEIVRLFKSVVLFIRRDRILHATYCILHVSEKHSIRSLHC